MSTDHTSRIANGTTEWAAGLLVDGLEPSTEHAITLDAGRPIARIHFAFEPGMPDDMRTNLVEGIGQAMNREMQSSAPATISAETARHVLFHYGRPQGYRPGSFTRQLMATIDAADADHTARLRSAYPDLVDAMNLAANERDGIAHLTAIANGKEA